MCRLLRLPSFPAEQVLEHPTAQIIDLRSPSEFAHDHLPGARNVPLFDDREREIVGTLYKQDSPQSAYDKGMSLVEQHIGELLEEILQRNVGAEQWQSKLRQLSGRLRAALGGPLAELDRDGRLDELGDHPLIVHCWRGGMRSQSVALLLRALGEKQVGLLEGGYKAYRLGLLEQLSVARPAEFPLLVVRGRTGVGKTEILHRLEAERAHTTLDLEGLASHRSSALGAVGLSPVSQPMFESRLMERIRQLRAAATGAWFVEGESRKVGDSVLPAALYAALQQAPEVRVTLEKRLRIERLGAEYLGDGASSGNPDPVRLAEISKAVGTLVQRLGKQPVERMQAQLAAGDWPSVVDRLLDAHYDPYYDRGGHPDGPRAVLDGADPFLLKKLFELRDSLASQSDAPE